MGQSVGHTSTRINTATVTTAAATVQQVHDGGARANDRRHRHHSTARKSGPAPTRPTRYQHMAKTKTRLQYNSMGERVVIRTAVDSIDAFAARSRQCSRRGQQEQQHQQQQRRQQHQQDRSRTPTGGDLVETDQREGRGEGGVVTPTPAGAQPTTSGVFGDSRDGGSNNVDDDGYGSGSGGGGGSTFGDLLEQTTQPPPPQNISKSLGFGFPDFSSVCSKVRIVLLLARPFSSAPPGLRSISPSLSSSCGAGCQNLAEPQLLYRRLISRNR